MLYSRFGKISALVLAMGGGLMALPSAAQSVFSASGELQVKITLVAACIVNGELTSNNDNDIDFGTLDFGEHTTFFDTAAGTASGGTNGNFNINCTPGFTPKLTFDGGDNVTHAVSPGTRAMKAGSQYVSYALFNNTTAIPIDQAINVTSEPFNINGIAYGGTGLNAGTYTDTVTITLTL